MPSTRKIAAQAGVSVGTVSRVLNNKSGVSDDVRRRVLEVAQELNYAPAKRVTMSRSAMTHIALLVRPLDETLMASPFYADVYHGIEQICGEQRINLSFSSMDILDGRVRTLPALLDDERMGGLVLVGAVPPLAISRYAEAAQVPIVLVDNWFEDCEWDTVMVDNVSGVRHATERLIEMGHEQIALISGTDHPSIVERRQGYEMAMLRHRLRPRIVVVTELGIGEGDAGAEEVARTLPDTTAVICSNDMQAFGALRRFSQLGYRVPEDISIVGFDDVAMSAVTNPALTTVGVDRIAFGRLAVELLLGRVQTPGRPPVHCTLGTRLVERASAAPPRLPPPSARPGHASH